ncbi:Dual specificity protein phosphatase 23 [Psilocybe cubensis]|uniref:Dual specificity protein phosphatase 23 n=2 Tax=Psilocybe cubensis TaxID=181762 RepID=A0ACB8HDW9_PSICU|nr:Dual specificity protein phosphatase 23 [Psilocybe cubensis]KAH9486205.1 Dual specificity protein phosphatase 23 [Psilocybe cubensis]
MATIKLENFRGCLALAGQAVDNFVNTDPSFANLIRSGALKPSQKLYHITVITKDELRMISSEQIQKITSTEVDPKSLFSLGIGGKEQAGIYWVVIIWAAGQKLRKQAGLPPKHFHITLSSNDIHDVDKGINSLISRDLPEVSGVEALDHTIFTLQQFAQYNEATEYSSRLILTDPNSHKGFLRMGDACFANGSHKIAMLSYACAYQRSGDQKVQSYCMKKLTECSKETEWGLVFQEHEKEQIENLSEISSLLLKPWSQDLQERLSDQGNTPSLLLEPRQPLYIPSTKNMGAKLHFYRLPRFFRWLIPYHLAIMSTPKNEDDITALASAPLGIRHVLTLTEEEPLRPAWFQGKSISNTFLPVPNYYPPSIEQMDLVMRLFDDQDKLPLLVHCGGGKGRAGTVAACYLAAFGFNKPRHDQDHPELAATEAISSLRALRPGSLETSRQEEFVSRWCSTIWKRQSVYPDIPSEPSPSPMEVEGKLSADNDLFVLVGLPGSGKSWFSKSLISRDPSKWTHISQDDSRSKEACETEIGRSPKGKHVLLDRCNTSAADRKIWLDLASNWCVSPVCILFDYSQELCTSRAQMRAGHPTLPPGSRVRNAVDQMQKIFMKPTLKEGFKAVITVRSFAAAEEAVLRFSSPVSILKFPRTPHLINTGAASADDVHTDLAVFTNTAAGHTVITEKIDGANMGFSLSSDRSRIIVQNRSHYVNSSTHEQFRKLGLWVERHDQELRRVLDRDPYFPERYILYGEWVYATHSIPYTSLPDYFIAYDLFDRSTKTWADTATLRHLLGETSIATAPIVHEGTMPTESQLLRMVQQPSMFYDGRVEGVYVKLEVNKCVKLRGKVVRSDFISGNEHWTRGGVRVNGLRLDQTGVE